MSLHDLLELLEAAGIDRDVAWNVAFYHVYNRRTGDERRTVERITGDRRTDEWN